MEFNQNDVRKMVTEVINELELYHGSLSNADFDKFDSKYLSTGWGEQMYGYGHYFTNSIEAAKQYAGNGIVYTVEVPDGKYLSYKSISQQEKRRIANLFFKYYTTESEYGREAYASQEAKRDFWQYECRYILECEDGGDIYGTIASLCGSDNETSKFLKSIGYVGIKWFDKNFKQNVTNYVIFDDNDIKILKKNKM
jgi:hypothetical protein